MSDREQDDEREQDEASSEGEGDDIGPDRKRGADDDSSEEEEDDPEEARRIAEGFIVDADEEDEEDDSDGNRKKKSKGKKKRRRERHSSAELEDDDLDLLLENTGAKPRVAKPSKSKPKKLRRRRSFSAGSSQPSGSSEDEEIPTQDLQHIFDDMPRKRKEAMMLDDDGDDMADFIEEDEGLGGDDEEAERARRKEKKRRLKNKQLGTKQGGEGGIDKAAWDDIYDVFGNGDEYDWVLEDEEQQMGGLKEGEKPNMHDVFEPSEIQERHLGFADDLIRLRDIPERHQLLNSTLSSQPTYVPDPFPKFPSPKLAARWISTRLSARTKAYFLPSSNDMYAEPSKYAELYSYFIRAIQRSLEFMFEQQLEVPFVYEHRRDYINHILADDGTDLANWEEHTLALLTRDELWKVYDLGLKYRSLHERREGLNEIWHKKLVPRLARDDEGDDSDGMDIDEGDDANGNPVRKKGDPRRTYFEEHVLGSPGTAEEGVEGVVDALEYLRSAFAKEMRELKEEEEELRKEGDVRVHKKPTGTGGKYGLDKLRETRLSQFIKKAAISVEEVVSLNLNSDNHLALQEDPPTLPLDYASEFTDAHGPLTQPAQVLEAVSSILVQDFTKNPTLRRMIRKLFREQGVLTILPTEKGLTKIDEFHPYYNFKYLKGKRVAELTSTSVFLHILEAEKELLVTVDVSLPEQAIAQLESVIFAAYRADGYSEKAVAWNEFRKSVVDKAVRKGLVPLGSKWVREWMKNEVEDFTAWTCGQALEEAANQSPYQPKVYEKGATPSVLAVSHGQGGPKDAIMCVFIDESGRIRETVKLDNLEIKHASAFDQQNEQGESSKPADDFKEFVQRRKPAVIVVGGLSYSTHRLTKNVKALITTLAEETIKQDEEEAGGRRPEQSEQEREQSLKDATIPVIYVSDNVARIYQHSLRAQQEFPTQPTTGRYCIGLGRFAQSPIHEFCALAADISAITFNEDSQNLVPREKLLLHLERALVNVVNDVGVAINDVVGDSYSQHVLPFVAGLGPRKAKKLIADIVRSETGGLINRGDLLRNNLLSLEVFTNAAAFLEIKHDLDELELGDSNVDNQPDPLDGTRIHPDDYEFARKMADNALDLDAEDTADDHPSKGVVRIMTEDATDDLLKELSLGDFADNLRKVRNVEKRLALETLKAEIADPARDRRRDFVIPSDWQVITMLTGESPATLRPGIIVAATVQRLTANDALLVLDSKIEGHVKLGFIANPDVQLAHPGDVLVKKQIVRAVCIDAKPADFFFEFSTRPIDMLNGDDSYRTIQRLEPYDLAREAADKEALQKKKKRETEKMRRQIDHPNFFNFSASQAEQHLVNMQRGDAVIRPSSKGIDRLALTWKVDDDLYQHIEVQERDKPNPTALGKILRVDDLYTYHDLDDLIVSHIGEIVSKGDQLIRSDKFKGRNIEELHNWLRSYVLAHPGKSNYAFGIDRNRPGYFVLAFLNKSESEGGSIQNWPVKVHPGFFKLGTAECPGFMELCNAFKFQYNHISTQNPAAGGRTPHAARLGGRTPMPGGSRTPGGSRLGGATPNPYAGYGAPSGQTPAYDQSTGRTPNPYAVTAPTPNPYQPQPTPNAAAAFPSNFAPAFTPGFPGDPAMLAHYQAAQHQQQQGFYPPAQAGAQYPPYGQPAPPPPGAGGARGPAFNPQRAAMLQNSQGGGGY